MLELTLTVLLTILIIVVIIAALVGGIALIFWLVRVVVDESWRIRYRRNVTHQHFNVYNTTPAAKEE
jgi:flagellar basal body-associated protein FliL